MQYFKTETHAMGASRQQQDWQVIKNLLPYLSAYKARIIFTIICLVAAKAANLGVPILLKHIVDAMSIQSIPKALLVVPCLLYTSDAADD
jgi:ABC-type multidrug transport system fused ATPase/permease subunit